METKDIEVKLSILKIIYEAVVPIYYKLSSLLEDVVCRKIPSAEADKAILMEYCSCASALKILLEEYFEDNQDISEDKKLTIPYSQYITIMSLSKTVELSTRTSLGLISMQEH